MEKVDFTQELKRLKRGPAIILQKDVGIILANTNIDKDSRVLDAGCGSGVLTANLARFVKIVYAYDNRKEFLDIAKENAKKLNLKNITFRNKDVFEEVKEKNLDLITLDLKDAWKALDNCKKALRSNGEIVAYFPHITQVSEFVNKLKKNFKVVKVVEDIQRDWVIEGRRARPEHTGILHTGFLVIVKRV